MALDEVTTGEIYGWGEDADAGEKVQGLLTQKEMANLPNGDEMLYEIKTPDGIVPVAGTKQLNDKMKAVSVGEVVVIEYVEDKNASSGNSYRVFKVMHGEATAENLADVGLDTDMVEVDDDGKDIADEENSF